MKIRGKVVLTACLLLGFYVGMFLLGHSLFLKSYYVYRNRSPFREAYLEVAAYSNEKGHELLERIRRIGAETGYKLSVVDGQGNIRFSSSPEFDQNEGGRIPKEHKLRLDEWIDSGNPAAPDYGILERRSDLSEIILIAQRNPGEYFIVSLPLKQLEANVEIALTFSLIIGVALLILGTGLITILSNRAIRPIKELTALSTSIATLDFSHRYTGSSGDELESLGISMNRISESLSSAMAALEKDVVLQRRFLAGLAHELKTPLGLIRGYAEAIAIGKAESKESIEKFTGIIIDESDRLDRMVGDILLIGRIEGNGFQLHPETVDLVKCIQDSVNSINALSPRITASLPDQLHIQCDQDRIRQVLDILLSNALSHGLTDTPVTVRLQEEEKTVRIEVENEGPFISEKHIPHLFTAFYRVENSRSRQSGGAGLGLSIAKGLIEAHGGDIGVTNRESGPGFWFTLPLDPGYVQDDV